MATADYARLARKNMMEEAADAMVVLKTSKWQSTPSPAEIRVKADDLTELDA